MLEFLISQIVNQFKPVQIILFGSFAKGTYHKNSDIDLCIVAETTDKRETLADMYADIESDRPFDIVLYTPGEWDRCIQDSCSFASHIVREGVVLYPYSTPRSET